MTKLLTKKSRSSQSINLCAAVHKLPINQNLEQFETRLSEGISPCLFAAAWIFLEPNSRQLEIMSNNITKKFISTFIR